MSYISELLDQFKNTVREHEVKRFTNHETDDFGYPLCACSACQQKLSRKHQQFLNAFYSGNPDPDRFPTSPGTNYAETEYDGDLGHSYADTMRDNGRPSPVAGTTFIQIADALPVIESPSIAADIPETAQQTLAYLAKHDGERSDG